MENANKAFEQWWQDYQAHYRARPIKDVFEYPKALMKEAYQAGYEDAIRSKQENDKTFMAKCRG